MSKWIDLDAGVPLGTFIFTGCGDVAEAAGLAGLDFVIVDREHAPASWDTTIAVIRAAAAADCPALVRVERLDAVEIGHAVDAGAAGVVVPRLRSVADVRATVAAARYAPVGEKGACPGARNADLGLRRRAYAGVTEESNRRFLLIGLIEDREGIDNLDAILAEAPGLDLVLLGRSDLAADLGHVGDIRHPEVAAAVARYTEIAGASGKGGVVMVAGEDPALWLGAGMRLLASGIDIEILARAFADSANGYRELLDRRAGAQAEGEGAVMNDLAASERILCDGLRFPEGPSFDAAGNLYVAEIPAGCVTIIEPNGRKAAFAELGGGPNGTAFGPDGHLYVMNNGGLTYANGRPSGIVEGNVGGWIDRVAPDGSHERVYSAFEGQRLQAPNDIAFDEEGGFYFTDSHHGTRQSRPFGQIYYCVPARGTIALAADRLQLPNGIAVSPDGRSVVAVETIPRLVVRFEVRRPGVLLGEKQVIATLPEGCLPDGIALDVDGNVVCAGLGLGVVIAVSPRGTEVRRTKMACTDPTNLAFGGPENRTVFVTEGVLGRVAMVEWMAAGAALAGPSSLARRDGDET